MLARLDINVTMCSCVFTCILGGVDRVNKTQLAISSGRSTYTIKHSIKCTHRSNVEGRLAKGFRLLYTKVLAVNVSASNTVAI